MQTMRKNKTQNFKYGELKEIVLRSLALGLVVGGTLVFPCMPVIIGSLIKMVEEAKGHKVTKSKVKRVLKELEKKDVIDLQEKDSEVYVRIKDNNNISVVKYSLKALLDYKRKKKEWSGKWTMVFFDVPEKQRRKRDYLRRFLHKLGFYQYQKSVYLFPYECEKEVALIKKIIEAGKYTKYIIADKIEDENKAKIFFGL